MTEMQSLIIKTGFNYISYSKSLSILVILRPA